MTRMDDGDKEGGKESKGDFHWRWIREECVDVFRVFGLGFFLVCLKGTPQLLFWLSILHFLNLGSQAN